MARGGVRRAVTYLGLAMGVALMTGGVAGLVSHEGTTRSLIGYLLTCRRTGAWQGSVQAPGRSLSHRLPTLVVWLSFGLRGPGVV